MSSDENRTQLSPPLNIVERPLSNAQPTDMGNDLSRSTEVAGRPTAEVRTTSLRAVVRWCTEPKAGNQA
jgi:hypothetical protein